MYAKWRSEGSNQTAIKISLFEMLEQVLSYVFSFSVEFLLLFSVSGPGYSFVFLINLYSEMYGIPHNSLILYLDASFPCLSMQ